MLGVGSRSAIWYPASLACSRQRSQTLTVRSRDVEIRWARKWRPSRCWEPQNAQVDMVSLKSLVGEHLAPI